MKSASGMLATATVLCARLAAGQAQWVAPPPPSPGEPASEIVKRAEKMLERHDYVGAESALREALTREPKLARGYSDMILALLGQRKAREAMSVGQRAVQLDPANPDTRFRYGLALSEGGHPVEAAREFERVVERIPGKPVPLRALASAYAAADDPRATETFEKVVALTPADAGLHAQFADYLWSHGQDHRGNAEIEDAICLSPRDARLHAVYGRSLYHQDRYLDAVRELRESLARGSRSYAVVYLLGNALREAGKLEEAQEAFESAIALDPANDLARHDLGKLLAALGKPELAIPHLEASAGAHPGSAPDLFDLGGAYEAAGMPAQAETCYRRAAAIAPTLPGPHYGLGRLLARAGRREEAQKELALYRTLYDKRTREFTESDSLLAEVRLGWLEMSQGDLTGALARFKSLPETTDTLIGEANALSRLGRHREAATVLDRARRISPDNREVRSLLAEETRKSGPQGAGAPERP